jgi:3-phenylpropionate/trans-cinnamate dioxygenase ferredoxin reductase subunit
VTDEGGGSTLVVGAGRAAFQLAVGLRAEGYQGAIRILGDEPHLPYQRPPLSKNYLHGTFKPAALLFQEEDYFARHGIEVLLNRRAVRIDRAARTVLTPDGKTFGYSHLVLATGARNRMLTDVCPAADGAVDLRTVDDAEKIRWRLPGARTITVIGAGFLGLEFAAVTAKSGAQVTVVEAGGALMGRAVSPVVGNAFRAAHEDLGVCFRMGTTVTDVGPVGDGMFRVMTSTGELLNSDLVLGSIGVVPNTELAEQAGLAVRNGIVVDEYLATEDPAISAIGDCAAFPSPFAGELCRIESVQNAIDQAKYLAQRLTGGSGTYDAVPWFWSDQAGLKLQIAGLGRPGDDVVVRGDPSSRSFSAYRFRDGALAAVESVRRPTDHMLAKRLLGAHVPVSPEQLRDPDVDLKALLPVAVTAS